MQESQTNPLNIHFLQLLRDDLAVFNSADLLAMAGGLQLLPDNAERTLRLEAFAHVCATLPRTGPLLKISVPRARQLLNQHPSLCGIAHGEDPYPGAFVEEVSFHGGSYPVFPGLTAGTTYVFSRLCQCLFGHRHPYPSVPRKTYFLIQGTLALSREIASRAGLNRTIQPISAPNGPIVLPDSMRIAQLKQAVSFHRVELESFFGSASNGSTPWDKLTVQAGTIDLVTHNGDDGPLLLRPIVDFGDLFIVSCPESLLSALNHHIVSIALEEGGADWLADTYNQAVVNSVERCFEYLDCVQLEWAPSRTDVVPGTRECVFWCDVDKFVFVIVATDDLKDFSPTTSYGTVHSQPNLANLLEKRFCEAEAAIYAKTPSLNGLLCMLIHQGVGRGQILGFGQVGVASLFQTFGGNEFEIFAELEAGDPLSLWRFARDSSLVRDRTIIQSWSALDEFGLYRSHHYSYYLRDEGPVDLITIATDFSGALQREASSKRDWHGVPNYDGKTILNVTTLHGTRKIPIYIPDPLTEDRAAAYVEGLPLPCWIIAPPESRNSTQHRVYAELANALAYWLWQCSNLLHDLPFLKDASDHPLVFLLSIDAPKEWNNRLQEDSTVEAQTPLLSFEVDKSNLGVTIEFKPRSPRLFHTANNEGERDLLRVALTAIRELFGLQDHVSDTQIDRAIEEHAPLGQKKMVLFLDGMNAPTLDPRGIPRFNPIPLCDLEVVLDGVGDYLTNVKRLSQGPIRREDRNIVLTSVVSYCFSRLEDYVRTLSPDGLLEYLLERNESTVRADALQRLMMPTRLACFSAVGDVVKEVKEDMAEITQSGLAGRFLIEYVAAQPPSGLRKMSLLVYNELRALAEQITTFGMSSDAVFYDLTDLELTILRSGRLGRIEPKYRAAQESHTTQITSERIARAAESFDRYWKERSVASPGSKPELAKQLDDAAIEEFGLSVTDLGTFLRGVRSLGMEHGYGIAVAELDSFCASLAANLGWKKGEIKRALDLFSLRSRSAFMDIGNQGAKVELYPWRYNRELSYLRRPLIQRPGKNGLDILWGNRHVELVTDNLLSLCLEGRLKAKSLLMRQFIGGLRHDQGERFNDQVADVLSNDPHLRVERRVKKIGDTRFDRLGDIDVLVGEPEARRIYVIECKDFSASRTPYELAREIDELVKERDGSKSVVQKHQARVDWITQHVAETLQFLRLDAKGKWKVCSVIVVDEPMWTIRLHELDAAVLTFEQLKSERLRNVN